MNNQLAIREDMTLSDLGMVLVKSGFFADSRDASQAIVKVLAGRELGFGPIASMTGVNIIKGRVSLSANLIAAAIKKSKRYTFQVAKGHPTNTECSIEFFEMFNGKFESLGVSLFTMEDAKRAGLAGGDNWNKYPKNMLFARAISNGAKWYCPDVFDGPIYTPDELGAVIDGETGEMIDVTPVEVKREPKPAPATLAVNHQVGDPEWQQVQPPKTNGSDISAKARDEWNALAKRAEAAGVPVPVPADDVTTDQLRALYGELSAAIKAKQAADAQAN